jgi:uncharacterized protein YqgC (DUF456 family)
MDSFMIYVWVTLLILVNLIWLAMIIFTLPGNWLMIITTGLFAWWQWDNSIFSVYTLVAIAILATIGEIIEFFGGAGGARKAGASKRGALGAIFGAIAGAIIGTFWIPVPIFGTLIGTCCGAGVGTYALELMLVKKIDHSIRSGVGAGVGVFIGTTAKFIIGIIIWSIIAITAFWA